MAKLKNRRRLLWRGLALGAAGALSLSGWALAAPAAPVPTQQGKTTVGVQTADISPRNLSYAVPLYVTVAAMPGDNGAQVVVPDGYSIRNTTGSIPDGTYPQVVVSKVEVQGVKGGTWSLSSNPTGGKVIKLSIGGLVLPDVTKGDTKFYEAKIKDSDNSFYNKTAGAFNRIQGGPNAAPMELPLAGTLPAGFQPTDEKAAAQFRIKYTVSLLDGSGEPIGISYDGPSKEDMANPAAPAGGFASINPPAPANQSAPANPEVPANSEASANPAPPTNSEAPANPAASASSSAPANPAASN